MFAVLLEAVPEPMGSAEARNGLARTRPEVHVRSVLPMKVRGGYKTMPRSAFFQPERGAFNQVMRVGPCDGCGRDASRPFGTSPHLCDKPECAKRCEALRRLGSPRDGNPFNLQNYRKPGGGQAPDPSALAGASFKLVRKLLRGQASTFGVAVEAKKALGVRLSNAR